MPGFSNTTYNDTLECLVSTMTEKISANPNYKFTDKAPTSVTYFNINKYKTTLDEAAKITLSEISHLSGMRWNKILKFMLYGIDTMQLNISVEDFGIQSQEIEGECIILPGTIEPYAGDFFLIDYIKEKVIFEITDVSTDTLENGANIYKLQYRSSSVPYDEKNISALIEDTYNFIVDNVGTNYKSVLKSEVSILAESISDYIFKLQEFYKNVFYSNRVQAFVYIYLNNDHFYDPYLVEFIISNDLMNSADGSNYLYICQQTKLPNTFSLKYAKTFYHALEIRDKNINNYYIDAGGKLIQDPTTTFYNRIEDYFELFYDRFSIESIDKIPCFRAEIVDAIATGKIFALNEQLTVYNIIIKYFNNIQIDQSDLDNLISILDKLESIQLYYAIPCIIYCLKHDILELIKK